MTSDVVLYYMVRILLQPARLVAGTRVITGPCGGASSAIASASDLRGTTFARHRTPDGPTPDRSPGQAKTDLIMGWGCRPPCGKGIANGKSR